MTRPDDAGGQAYWDGFARARTTESEEASAALALHGFCPVYDAYRARAEKIVVEELLPVLDASATALDIGCGPGRWTAKLAQRCARVVAMDYAPAMLNHAKQTCEAAGVARRVSFQRGTLEHLEAQALGGPFDIVFAFGVVQYLPPEQLSDAARRIAEALKPGGVFLHREILAPRPFARESNANGATLVSYHKSFDQYRAAFEAAGLQLNAKRSILPPSLALSFIGRMWPFSENARNSLGRGLLRVAIAAREWIFDPLWRLFPDFLWRVNRRRPTDQALMLYEKRSVEAVRA